LRGLVRKTSRNTIIMTLKGNNLNIMISIEKNFEHDNPLYFRPFSSISLYFPFYVFFG
jgi:hypothetical protein